MKKIVLLGLLALAIGGCSTVSGWFSGEEKPAEAGKLAEAVKPAEKPAPAAPAEAETAPAPAAPALQEKPLPDKLAAGQPESELDCSKAVLSLWCGNLLTDRTDALKTAKFAGGVPFYLKRLNLTLPEFIEELKKNNSKLLPMDFDSYAAELRKNRHPVAEFEKGKGREALVSFFEKNRFSVVDCSEAILAGHAMSYNDKSAGKFSYYKRPKCGPGEKILLRCTEVKKVAERKPLPPPPPPVAVAPPSVVPATCTSKYGIPQGKKRLVLDAYVFDDLPQSIRESINTLQKGRTVGYRGRKCDADGGQADASVSRCFGFGLAEARRHNMISAVPNAAVNVAISVGGAVSGRAMENEKSLQAVSISGRTHLDLGPEGYGQNIRLRSAVPSESGYEVYIPAKGDYILFGNPKKDDEPKTEWGQCGVGVAIFLKKKVSPPPPAAGQRQQQRRPSPEDGPATRSQVRASW